MKLNFFSLLAAIFITLKLIGVINWSWVLVLAPLWIPAMLAVVSLMIVIVLGIK